jgi:hypothetical protein
MTIITIGQSRECDELDPIAKYGQIIAFPVAITSPKNNQLANPCSLANFQLKQGVAMTTVMQYTEKRGEARD